MDLATELSKITEAYALLHGLKIERRHSDAELVEAMSHVLIATARLRALQLRDQLKDVN